MMLRVDGCIDAAGRAMVLPSLWESLVKLFVGATLGRAEIVNVDTRNPCIRSSTYLLTRLGFRVEALSPTKLYVEKTEEPGTPLRLSYDFVCGFLDAYLALPFFAINAPPGSQLIARAINNEYLMSVDTRPIREVLAALGARVWSAGTASKFLVVETSTATRRIAFVRLTHAMGSVVGGLAVALASSRAPSTVLLGTYRQEARRRLQVVIDTLRQAGYNVQESARMLQISSMHEDTEQKKTAMLSVGGGISETLTLLILVRQCNPTEILIDNLSSFTRNDDVELFKYLLSIMGYEYEQESSRLVLHASKPASVTYSASEEPLLAVPLVLHSLVAGGVVSDIRSTISDGVLSRFIEKIVRELGGEAYLEDEDRFRVISPISGMSRHSYSCRGIDPVTCLALLVAALRSNKRIILEDARSVLALIPLGLQVLQELGVNIVVEKTSRD
ncbi:hypothetical protein PYJP_04560 [Pyrofollis japonicus]|uniref:hypothetical protein n=1 Tax=Pyrofollis japonicus TaxID=3060460 RepID=UPI00295AB393|nr:hypothetical protein [Pyrofollis japonicus]BEP17104.1 hypothetical protein PYJP_04560 [Pyrofollis japonicus]